MPVRSKAIGELARSLHKTVVYNNVDMTVEVDGRDRDRKRFWEKHSKAYDRVVHSIDWNRVLIEASILHMVRQEKDSAHQAFDYGDEVCGSCVMYAMLADKTWPDWEGLAEKLTEEGR